MTQTSPFSRTFQYVYSVNGTSLTGLTAVTGKTETIGYTSSTITYTGTSDANINESGAFPSNGPTYLGAVVQNGTIIGYLMGDTGKSKYYIVSDNPITSTGTATLVTTDQLTICFMAGTMIATPEGEVAVEMLKAGDLVNLADGGTLPITWLGRQTVATQFADPLRVNPIRVRADALADGVPSRDLLLSPDHALLVDGVLVQAGALVNGESILRETEVPEVFTYYHVEIASHALILADNTPAETFIDNVDRMGFDNWAEHPGEVQLAEMDLPRAKSARQVPATIRLRLLARAETLFGTQSDAAAA